MVVVVVVTVVGVRGLLVRRGCRVLARDRWVGGGVRLWSGVGGGEPGSGARGCGRVAGVCVLRRRLCLYLPLSWLRAVPPRR